MPATPATSETAAGTARPDDDIDPDAGYEPDWDSFRVLPLPRFSRPEVRPDARSAARRNQWQALAAITTLNRIRDHFPFGFRVNATAVMVFTGMGAGQAKRALASLIDEEIIDSEYRGCKSCYHARPPRGGRRMFDIFSGERPVVTVDDMNEAIEQYNARVFKQV